MILLPPDETLPQPIRCHPDSIFAAIGNRLIFPRSYADTYPAVMEEIASCGGFELLLSDTPRGSVHPLDAGLNVSAGRDFLLCRPDTVDPLILQTADSLGLPLIPTRQSYAGCACLVTDAGILTFDCGIARSLSAHEIHHLLLTSGGISLPGYNSGFFGGACGFHDGVIYVHGNHRSLPCCPQLENFAESNGYTVVSLCMSPVTDVGGIRIFQT